MSGRGASGRRTVARSTARARHANPLGAASFQPKSCNRKLGPVALVPTAGRPRPEAHPPFVASTYVSIASTCSSACPFKGNGCFIQHGPTRALASSLDVAARGIRALDVIREEVRLLDRSFRGGPIPPNGGAGPRDLRLHVGGDVGSESGARLLARAAERWRSRGGGLVWTYTHWWRKISREAWGDDISVLASVEGAEDIEAARQRGYASAIVVERFPSDKAFGLPGSPSTIVPCPAETRGRTCVECRLCFDDQKLLSQSRAIAFEAHGNGRKLVASTLVQLRRKSTRSA